MPLYQPIPDPEALLNLYPARVRPTGTILGLGGGGGHSGSRLWRFESGVGPLLLRAWPSPGPARSRLERIHQWLGFLAELGFVPLPLPGGDGRTLQEHGGRLWEIVPWREGEVESSDPPNPSRVREAFRALASVHRRWEGEGFKDRSPGLLDRLNELEALNAKGFGSIGQSLGGSEDPSLDSVAREWLGLAPAAVEPLRGMLKNALAGPVWRQPCLRDVRPAHFLFVGDRLNGLVDFGAMGEETVAGDLARLSAEWLGDRPWLRKIALDAYEAVRPLDPSEHRLIPVFETSSAVLTGAHWLRWHFLEGRRFEDPGAVKSGVSRSLALLERAIQGMLVV